MAKTNRKPSDKFERKQRLAQRPRRNQDDLEPMNLYQVANLEVDDEIADEILSARTNRAY